MSEHRQPKRVRRVLLLFFVLATIYNIATPLFEGYDEQWHYGYVHYLLANGALPRQPAAQYPHLARQEASQPPLYYVLVAALIGWMPQHDPAILVRDNPQFRAIPTPYRDNQNAMVHTSAERFPYRGVVLAVHLARMVSTLLGIGTVYCTYLLARTLFPGESTLALGAMGLVALTPGFLFTSALVSNDPLIVFLCSLGLVLLAQVWTGVCPGRKGVLLGLVLGGAALAKLTGLALWLLAGLTLLHLAWRKRNWQILVEIGMPAFLIAFLISGWWYIRNWVFYHDWTGLRPMLDIVGRRDPGFGLFDVLREFEGIRWSYWALFGWFNVPVASWLYRFFDLLSLLALIGLALHTA